MPSVTAQVVELRRLAAVAVVAPDRPARRAIGQKVLDRRGVRPPPALVMPRPNRWLQR